MKASVIIATYGRDSCLVETIRCVLQQDYPDFELLIVDQSVRHTPEVESFLRKVDDPRYSYCLITPPSLPAARNFGLSRAQGEIVIFVDDDVLLDEGFIEAHVRVHERLKGVAAVGGRVRLRDLAPDTRLYTILNDGSPIGSYDFPDEGDLDTVQGCNMSFRRAILEDIGAFDPSYEGNAFREESDVSFRLRRRGYRIRFEPKAALEHLAAPTGGCRVDDVWSNKIYYQNETLFHLRNRGLRFFFLFIFSAFRSYVWPHKRSLQFWRRLKAFFSGIERGIWLALFPKKLHPSVVWELSRSGAVATSAKM
jgi:GT2 family glycosyltransferase